VEQLDFGNIENFRKLDQFSKDELITKFTTLENEYQRAIKEIYRLKYQNLTEEQLNIVLSEHLNELRFDMYGASSERYKKPAHEKKKKEKPDPRIKKPSQRYPNVTIREIPVQYNPPPGCDACGKIMMDSGMTEDSEQLTVTPKKYEILKYMRSIYRCSCQSCMKTAPTVPRILEGSTYSDEMIIDVALSKYCDLIPIERYVQMASRTGLINLPPNTLYDLTHKLAFFMKEIYQRIGAGVFASRVINADETPQKMLEGSDKKNWYLWGFSTQTLCYFDCRDTRSGDVVIEPLINSKCEILVSDVFSGYHRAIRLTNIEREKKSLKRVRNANCNAHSRRYFYKFRYKYPEACFYLDHYHEIYQLESQARGKPLHEAQELREKMRIHFELMKAKAEEELPKYFKGNKYFLALNYFIENYQGLTMCLEDPEIPLDNNRQERHFRSHVVGRKTWYGTHSEQGAETAAILFTIVETCKLNGVNPREYFPSIVKSLLNRGPALTPIEWKNQKTEQQ
jgi:transposase